ncbi:MAG: PilN domain-containing protein [Patescibacteria group bacterium]|nr:PilN domain-containing protein [Patescibacteria group bacterium]
MKYRINLLPEKKISLGGDFFYFVENYLKYILVITQLVVIFVFFYRFSIDQQVIDLKESVTQKREIVRLVLPMVKELARIENKTKEIKGVLKKQETFKESTLYFFSIIPKSVTIENFEMKNNLILAKGKTNQPADIELLIDVLEAKKKFKRVDLKNLTKDGSNYQFLISLEN